MRLEVEERSGAVLLGGNHDGVLTGNEDSGNPERNLNDGAGFEIARTRRIIIIILLLLACAGARDDLRAADEARKLFFEEEGGMRCLEVAEIFFEKEFIDVVHGMTKSHTKDVVQRHVVLLWKLSMICEMFRRFETNYLFF